MVVVALKEPDVPVTVTVAVPLAAFRLAVNVNVLVPVAGFGLKDAVTPLGRALVDKATLPAKPLAGVTVIVVDALAFWSTVTLDGDADSVKLPETGAVTVKETDVVCVTPPPVPVTVIVYVPAATLDPTAMPMVELPDPGAAMDAGLNVTVTPLGWPDADKLTAESNPPLTAVLIVDEPLFPCTTDKDPGEAEMLKLGVPEELPANALINPTPFGLPQPVTRSYPTTAE
jgi:hypothetical protein